MSTLSCCPERGGWVLSVPPRRPSMKITYCSLAAVTLLATGVLRAQAPAAPNPGPEQQKLAYFAGRWTEVGVVKPGLTGPGGPMNVTSNCEWFAGGFNIVCRSE